VLDVAAVCLIIGAVALPTVLQLRRRQAESSG
jgi:hypothetical protein